MNWDDVAKMCEKHVAKFAKSPFVFRVLQGPERPMTAPFTFYPHNEVENRRMVGRLEGANNVSAIVEIAMD